MVLFPVVVMVPRADPVAVQTVLAFGSAAKVQVTALLLVPVTVAVYCTVLAVAVLTGTEAGDAGDEVTATKICFWPPLPGAWAMHPASGKRTDATIKQDNMVGKDFRKGPSDGQKCIRMFWGGERKCTPYDSCCHA